MSRDLDRMSNINPSFPRTRGDEPFPCPRLLVRVVFSPHTRG